MNGRKANLFQNVTLRKKIRQQQNKYLKKTVGGRGASLFFLPFFFLFFFAFFFLFSFRLALFFVILLVFFDPFHLHPPPPLRSSLQFAGKNARRRKDVGRNGGRCETFFFLFSFFLSSHGSAFFVFLASYFSVKKNNKK